MFYTGEKPRAYSIVMQRVLLVVGFDDSFLEFRDSFGCKREVEN